MAGGETRKITALATSSKTAPLHQTLKSESHAKQWRYADGPKNRLARLELEDLPPDEYQIVSTYGVYITLLAFWMGYESDRLNETDCPFTLSCDVSAFKKGQEAAARISWLRGRECPSCS